MRIILLFTCLLFIISFNSCKKDTPVENTHFIGDLNIPGESVILNPSGFNALSALIKYSSDTIGRTKIIVEGKHGTGSDIEHWFNDNGKEHSVPVIGLYGDYENTVHIFLTNDKGDYLAEKVIKIKTDTLPYNLPNSITTNPGQNDKTEKGINLVSNFSASLPQMPLMVDNYGDVRWLLNYTTHYELTDLAYDCGIARLKNGNFYFGDQATSNIYEVDLLGNVINKWPLPGYTFHHNVYEKPNGNFLISVSKPGSLNKNGVATIEDFIIEINRETGVVINEWDLKQSLDELRDALTTSQEDWMHVNSVMYDPSDNTIIISGRTQGVVKLTYDNKVKWILSAHRGWTVNRRGEDLKQYLLTPLDAAGNKINDSDVLDGNKTHPDFDWNWFQHSNFIMPNGDMMLFDNGTTRNFNNTDPNHYSRAVEYKIDPLKMTVQQIWSYGKERGMETYSRIVSSVQYLPGTNHVLFCPGFQVQNSVGQGGKIVEIDYATKQVVFEMSISSANLWGFHRAKRMNAYPD